MLQKFKKEEEQGVKWPVNMLTFGVNENVKIELQILHQVSWMKWHACIQSNYQGLNDIL